MAMHNGTAAQMTPKETARSSERRAAWRRASGAGRQPMAAAERIGVRVRSATVQTTRVAAHFARPCERGR
eukprot:1344397-Prymnesium_polylepis.1